MKIAFIAALLGIFIHASQAMSAEGISLKTGLTAAERTAVLDEHNRLRTLQAEGKVQGQPGAADMTRLEWNDKVAAHAQTWANECDRTGHGNHKPFGEGQNIASNGDRKKLLKDAFESWFTEEYPKYTYGSVQPGAAGHYTQTVTAYSHELGCGANACDGHTYARLVCNFFVGGNMYGKQPFVEGPACSKCPAGYGYCKDSLCTSNRVCKKDDSSCRCVVNQQKCAVNGEFLADSCECRCKRGWMGLNCDVECEDNPMKGCSKSACQPSAENKFFVDKYLNCPASCGRCQAACKNKMPDCAAYQQSGSCTKYKDYMKEKCAKECGFCQ